MTKEFSAEKIRLNLVNLIQQASDPSAGGGVAAAIGSFYLRSGTGQSWLKTAVADTGWTKLVQSFAWYSVKDYGALGDNSTNDTASVQAAIDACATAGGGIVFFPYGTYRCSALTINAQNNVQLVGSGVGSSIRWTQNAGGAAVSLITISGSANLKITSLKFDGAGLTNPAASRLNHLIAVGTAAADVTDVQIMYCRFTGMVASSGDGVHLLGDAGDPVQGVWVKHCYFDGCSRYGVGIEQGVSYAWIADNFMTNCETEIVVEATAALASIGIEIRDNIVAHTSISVRHAIRIEGDASAPCESVVLAENVVLGGFITTSGVLYGTFSNNVQTSGAFASAEAAWRVTGNVNTCVFQGNTIVRAAGATAGPCISFEEDGGDAPELFRASNMLINDGTGGNFVTIVDCIRWSLGRNLCHMADATGTVYGFDIQAVTVDLTDVLIGPGNQFSAAAGSMDACVRLLSNGADINDVSVVGNIGDNCDYGVRAEGGTFGGQFMHAGNNWDATSGDLEQVGVTLQPSIGFNLGTAGTVGPQCRYGSGSPEGVVSAPVGSVYLNIDGGQAVTFWYKETGAVAVGWVALGGWPIVFGAQDVGTAATALFLAPGWIAAATATEPFVVVSRPGTIRNLYVQVTTAGTDNQLNTYTTRKNGVDQTLVATIANNANGQASDVTNSFSVVAGDRLSMKVTKAGVVTAGQQFVTACAELV